MRSFGFAWRTTVLVGCAFAHWACSPTYKGYSEGGEAAEMDEPWAVWFESASTESCEGCQTCVAACTDPDPSYYCLDGAPAGAQVTICDANSVPPGWTTVSSSTRACCGSDSPNSITIQKD